MLILHNISSAPRQKERGIKVTVSQKHGLPSCENGETSDLKNAYKAKRPYKQGYAVECHTLSAHVRDGHQKIYTSLDASDTRNVQTKNCQVNRSPGVTQSAAKRRIS